MTNIATLLLLACGAGASTIYTLDHDGCTGGCGGGPFGAVTLTQTSATSVRVTEELAAFEAFAGTGAGQALEFNLLIAASFELLTPGFAAGPAPASASAFGSFRYSVACTVCQGGKPANPGGPLSFTVSSPAGLSIADFLPNDRGYVFASDIRGSSGRTGNVAAMWREFQPPAGEVPEPATLLLIGAGLAGLSRLRRRDPG